MKKQTIDNVSLNVGERILVKSCGTKEHNGIYVVMPKIQRRFKSGKELRKECDKLWARLVKLRAGNQSELSGKTGLLVAHHIFGKPNLRLRYELDNGICLTAGEHRFIAHVEGRRHKILDFVKKKLGEKRFQELESMRRVYSKVNLQTIKIYFLNELKKYKGQNNENV